MSSRRGWRKCTWLGSGVHVSIGVVCVGACRGIVDGPVKGCVCVLVVIFIDTALSLEADLHLESVGDF